MFTCTVGQKPSKAEFFLDDYSDVISLLKSLNVVSTKVGICSLVPSILQSRRTDAHHHFARWHGVMQSNRNYSLSDMQSFLRDNQNRAFLSAPASGSSVSRSATADSPFRRTPSRYAMHNQLCVNLSCASTVRGEFR